MPQCLFASVIDFVAFVYYILPFQNFGKKNINSLSCVSYDGDYESLISNVTPCSLV